MTHFNTTALFHSSKESAGRFSENVFKMLSQHYVAAIKPAACVHSLLSSPVHVCSVASPLLQPQAHVLGLYYHVCREGENELILVDHPFLYSHMRIMFLVYILHIYTF